MLSTPRSSATVVTGVLWRTCIKPTRRKPTRPKIVSLMASWNYRKTKAVQLEPYDTVTVQGFYRSQPEVNDAITKAAKQKGAYAFYIVRQIDANQGGNQRITAFIYKQDAKNASSRARTLFRQTLKLAAPRWLRAAKLRRKSKFRASPRQPRRAPK